MDDKSLPYNLRLRKDHKPFALTEPSRNQKHERDFQGKGGEEVYGDHVAVDLRCGKCGCSFDLETSLRSHHCKNKSEKDAMENQVVEGLELGENKSLRRRRRKGIPIRAPFF